MMVYKLLKLTAFLSIHFFSCDAPVHVILKFNKFLFIVLVTFLLLIYLLSVYFKPQLLNLEGRGKSFLPYSALYIWKISFKYVKSLAYIFFTWVS